MDNQAIKEHWDKTIALLKEDSSYLYDKTWRLENLYFFIDKKGVRRLFKLNRAQRHYFSRRKNKNIILKSRQLGFTTLITLSNLDNVLFKQNVNALAIAHTKEGMADIFGRKTRYALQNLHEEIKMMWGKPKSSTTHFQVNFMDGSNSSFSVSLSGIGGTFQYVHISEFAKLFSLFPDRAERVTQETFPAVPFDGEIDIESTAESTAGPFYEMYQEAMLNEKEWNESLAKVNFFPHFYNWTWDDTEMETITETIPVEKMESSREIDWKSYQMEHGLSDREINYYYQKWIYLGKDKNIEQLHSQYPTTWEEAFIASGTPYFNSQRVLEMMLKCKEPKNYEVENGLVEVVEGPLMVWEQPIKNETYVIGGDTAEGLSHGDASTLVVVNAKTRKIVAVYRNNIEPGTFSSVCSIIGKFYNNALLAVEVNKDGLWVNDNLQRSGYANLYFREVMDDITKTIGKLFGWKTDKKTRDTMLTELKTQFLKIEMPIKPLLQEMMTFIRNRRGKPEAVSGRHDDIVMAAAIAYEVLKQRYPQDGPVMLPQNTSMMDFIFGKTL